MPARFFEQEVKARLRHRRMLSAFLDTLVSSHRKELQRIRLHYIFCGDEQLLEINRQFLQHDTLTDIITFDLSESPESLEGEIYISTERVAENATAFGTGYQEELHRVIFHGALHLCGFGDKKQEDQKQMRLEEDRSLELYFKAKGKA